MSRILFYEFLSYTILSLNNHNIINIIFIYEAKISFLKTEIKKQLI